MTPQDIERVGEIWLAASIEAHNFVPADFWRVALETMTRDLLPQAEVYVHMTEERVDAFIALADDFIHGLFVEPARQRRGVGRLLLSHAKRSHRTLRLNVYQQNPGARRFYESHGFGVCGESTCPHTGCAEFEMVWQKRRVTDYGPERRGLRDIKDSGIEL